MSTPDRRAAPVTGFFHVIDLEAHPAAEQQRCDFQRSVACYSVAASSRGPGADGQNRAIVYASEAMDPGQRREAVIYALNILVGCLIARARG